MARRPSLRIPPPRRQAARGFRNDLRNIAPDMRRAVGEALRSATRSILSELYDASPAYSGAFRNKWYSQVEGRNNKVFIRTGVPTFKDEDLKRGAPTILLGNTSSYAQEAMDLIPGTWIRQEESPVKTPVAIGFRVGRFRGDVADAPFEAIVDAGKRPAISTAEPDWYSTYMNGGGFSQAFRQGSKAGFIRPVT